MSLQFQQIIELTSCRRLYLCFVGDNGGGKITGTVDPNVAGETRDYGQSRVLSGVDDASRVVEHDNSSTLCTPCIVERAAEKKRRDAWAARVACYGVCMFPL